MGETIRYCKKCGCELISTNKHKLCDSCRRKRAGGIRNGVLSLAGIITSVAVFIGTKGKNGGGNKA